MYTHSAPLSKGQRGFGTTVYRHSGPLDEGQRRGGRQCTDTQDLYLKVRGDLKPQCTDTQDLYMKVRGEVADSVQTLRTSIQWSEGRLEIGYRHSGPLCKGKRRGGRHCTDTQDFYVKVRWEVGTQCRATQDLYLKFRGEVGTKCTHRTFVLRSEERFEHSVHTLRTSI